MLHPFLKMESERIKKTTMRITSRGLKISKTRRMSSMSSSAETEASPPSVQKLTLREILSIELAIQKPLRYSEVPIPFSRDDQ
jgi:hypothetical protein